MALRVLRPIEGERTLAELLSRRSLLFGKQGQQRVYPPGISANDLAACTGCGACATDCPTAIIEFVADKPVLNFQNGACTFCGACEAACPEPVFSQREDHERFDHIVSFGKECLAFHRVDCQACRDSCPTAAIRFRPVRGGPFYPELNKDACTGCGACISICPVDAVKVSGVEVAIHG